jgi:hypothetical protein
MIRVVAKSVPDRFDPDQARARVGWWYDAMNNAGSRQPRRLLQPACQFDPRAASAPAFNGPATFGFPIVAPATIDPR